MFTATIDRPDVMPRQELEARVVEAYHSAELSSSQLGEMLGLDSWDTRTFLTEHQVYPQYDVEDLMQDIENLKRLKQKTNFYISEALVKTLLASQTTEQK